MKLPFFITDLVNFFIFTDAALTIIVLTPHENNIVVTWNSTDIFYYNIEVSYSDGVFETWNTSEAFVTLHLLNTTANMTVSFCRGEVYPSNFTIGIMSNI